MSLSLERRSSLIVRKGAPDRHRHDVDQASHNNALIRRMGDSDLRGTVVRLNLKTINNPDFVMWTGIIFKTRKASLLYILATLCGLYVYPNLMSTLSYWISAAPGRGRPSPFVWSKGPKPHRCVCCFERQWFGFVCNCRTSRCGMKVNGGSVGGLKKRTYRFPM